MMNSFLDEWLGELHTCHCGQVLMHHLNLQKMN